MSQLGAAALGAGTSFVLAVLLTPLARRLALDLGVVDSPGPRRPHSGPVPRLGGLALYAAMSGGLLAACSSASAAAMLVGYGWSIEAFLGGASVVLLAGVIDDARGLSPGVKLTVQIIAAGIAVVGGFGFDSVTNPLTGGPFILGGFGIVLSILWIVAITNAFNLIDGLDGLAAGVGLIACVTIVAIAQVEQRPDALMIAAVIGAALLGFLRYNFHPATIFLGDSGSLVLGYMLALLSIRGLQKGTTLVVVLVPLLTLGLPILDTSVTIVRRYLIAGWAAIFRADQEHLHHRLLALGMTHRRAVLTLYGVAAALGLCGFLVVFVNGWIKALLLAVAAGFTWSAIGRLGYGRKDGPASE